MEVLINIPQKAYEQIIGFPQQTAGVDILILHKILQEGKVLPKGHGDLIDRSKLNITDLSPDPWYSPQWGYSEWEIDDADVVVEADKEGAE